MFNAIIKGKRGMMVLVIIIVLASIISACTTASSEDEASTAIPENTDTVAEYDGMRVLLINSYHEGHEWSDNIQSGARATFEDTGVEFRVVHMDMKRNSDTEFREAAAQDALNEIETFDPDVVIVTEDNGQTFLVQPHLLDTELPVIFVGVNWDASTYGYPADNVTGMIEVELVSQVIEQLSQYTDGDRIGYIAIDSSTEQKTVGIYQERFFDGELEVRLVDTYEAFTAAFLELQEQVDIVLLGSDAGATGEWDADEAAQFFAENTTVPTGGVRTRTTPYALLVLAKDGTEQGEWASQTALQILDGTSVSDIEIVENQRGLMFLNMDIAAQLDISFSPSMLRNAEIFQSETAGE